MALSERDLEQISDAVVERLGARLELLHESLADQLDDALDTADQANREATGGMLKELAEGLLSAYQKIEEDKAWSEDARAAMSQMIGKHVDAVSMAILVADQLAATRAQRLAKASTAKVDELLQKAP